MPRRRTSRAPASGRSPSAATRPLPARQLAIDAFNNDPVRRRGLLATAAASASTCRRRRTSCWPSCRGRPPSRRRRSTACTASARTSRSRRGGSSPRTRSTRRSPSSSTRKAGARRPRARRRGRRSAVERLGPAVGTHASRAAGARRGLTWLRPPSPARTRPRLARVRRAPNSRQIARSRRGTLSSARMPCGLGGTRVVEGRRRDRVGRARASGVWQGCGIRH